MGQPDRTGPLRREKRPAVPPNRTGPFRPANRPAPVVSYLVSERDTAATVARTLDGDGQIFAVRGLLDPSAAAALARLWPRHGHQENREVTPPLVVYVAKLGSHCLAADARMTSLIESIKKGPVMTMTLKCDTEFPKALKNIMESMGLKGEAVYKGFPVMDDGQEYWWVQLHLYKDEEDDPKKMEHWMFTNPELHTSFFDSARCVAWAAINELGERLKYRLHNTQKDLKEEKEETANLNTTVGRLRSDMVDLSLKLRVYEELNKAKDSQIATLRKRMLLYSGSS
ncbi:hypothetical protein QYE76_026069 [Lolium multiflorum]|uniref:Uncharacterized protein n=1 Tax=Lolium multiflorum TaxID=4521 RepID=A0AAD8VUT2_LOLMU|nr:hypothetical protein QYE76_026069 [Lolium multiflorum]